MTNMDPASTQSADGGAVYQSGPDTVGGVQSEFEFERDPFSGSFDGDGDGDPDLDEQRWDSWEEVEEHQQKVAELQALEREEAAAEAAAAEAAAEAEAAAQAAREEAAANGEPYHEGTGTHDGEPVDIFTMPDGATYMVNEDGEVVAVAFPSEPVFMGYVTTTEGSMQLFELYDGSQVVVHDGELVGTLDEVELATVSADIIPDQFLPPDTLDDVDEFYLMPMGPPSYDTQMVDAATGEAFHELDTGTNLADGIPVDGAEAVSTYQPPGADYTMHIQDGEVVNVVPVPEEPEWSFLGIVEYYEDGTVSIDLAIVEVDVDLIGPEKGISVGVDLFFIEVGAGVEWDSDGNWDFEAYVDVDLGTVEWGGDLEMSWEDGEFAAAVDGYVGVQFGTFEAMAEGGVDIQVGDDGVELGLSAAASASGSFMGTEVELQLEGAVEVGPGGVEGRFGANGSMESELFGDYEAGASWDSESGFDSYAGRTDDDGGGGGQGLDMGWTDEVGTAEEFDGGSDQNAADAQRFAESGLLDDAGRPLHRGGDGHGASSAIADDERPLYDAFDDVMPAPDGGGLAGEPDLLDEHGADPLRVVFEPNDEPVSQEPSVLEISTHDPITSAPSPTDRAADAAAPTPAGPSETAPRRTEDTSEPEPIAEPDLVVEPTSTPEPEPIVDVEPELFIDTAASEIEPPTPAPELSPEPLIPDEPGTDPMDISG